MKKRNDPSVQANPEQRRRFLRLFGTAAAILPITVIVGCSDDGPTPPASPARSSDQGSTTPQAATPEPEPPTPPAPEPQAEPEPESMAQQATEPAAEPATGDMPQVNLDDPTAQALGYKHDVANVDTEKYPAYRAGQACANCTLYQGASGDTWGGCQLFPGKLVNANGWCSGYTPKA